MEHDNQTTALLDTFVEKFLRERGRTISRRGILARLGKFSLGILGVSLLPNLPLDRTFVVEAQGDCCYWPLCGINGYLCSPGGATGNSCPSGTTVGPTYWSKCCTNGELCGEGGTTVDYWDCCASTSAAATSVRGAQCAHNPSAGGAWCPQTAPFYGCTYAVQRGPCSSPAYNPC